MNRTTATSPAIDLAGKLVRLARELAAQEARDLEAIAVGPTQHALLELIITTPGLCPTTAAEHLAVDKSAVTRAVKRLELNGYVERRRSRRDRRVWELYPTRYAGVASGVARPCALSPATRLLAGFRDEEVRRLRDDLDRLGANLAITPAEVVRRAVWGSGAPWLPEGWDRGDDSD